jgi:putative DNA primase/helicase
MLDLRLIARALGGEVSGRQVLAPGPGHTPRDRSLAVRVSNDAPDGFLVYSHAGDDWRTCREHVRSRLGLPAWEPGDEHHQRRTIKPAYVDRWDFGVVDAEAEDRTRSEDDLVRIEWAQALWSEAADPRRTIAEDYLRSRALALPDELAGSVLRFHPKCPWRNENTGRTDRIPCLIAAFRSIDDDIVTGIHRIRLDQPGRWPKTQRLMLRRGAPCGSQAGPSGLQTHARRRASKPAWPRRSSGLDQHGRSARSATSRFSRCSIASRN